MLGDRVGADLKSEESQARHLTYVTSIVFGRHSPEAIGLRTAAEMQTVARCLDAIGSGELPSCADMLVQRLQALEMSVKDKNWNLAKNIEIVPQVDSGLTTMAEREDAARRLRLFERVDGHARGERRAS